MSADAPPQTLADLADHCRTQAAEWDQWATKMRCSPGELGTRRERYVREAVDHAADWRALAELTDLAIAATWVDPDRAQAAAAHVARLASRLETP